jgi:hypothetical protein
MQNHSTAPMRSSAGIASKVSTPMGKAPGSTVPDQPKVKPGMDIKGFGGAVINPKIK